MVRTRILFLFCGIVYDQFHYYLAEGEWIIMICEVRNLLVTAPLSVKHKCRYIEVSYIEYQLNLNVVGHTEISVTVDSVYHPWDKV